MEAFDLNLRHLRAIGHIVRQRSLNRAAETAGLSQPALTQALSKIERQLGVPLFERNPDGVAPTPAGLAFAERVERAFAVLGSGGRRSRRGFASPEALMTATQARAFLHFADAGSFSGGANRGGMSQPAVHRAVRELEQIWGTPLAERRGRGVVLTAAGRALARRVRLAAAELSAGIAEVRGDEAEGGRITVGAMPLSRALLLPHALAAFLADAPHTVVDVVEGSWRELVDPLLDGSIDLMIGALRAEAPAGLAQRPLFTDRLAVFGRREHPLAGKPVGLEALAEQPWVVGTAGTPLRAHWEELFASYPQPPAPVECGSVMVIRGLLAQSNLLTLLSPDQVALEVEAGMLVRIGPELAGTRRTIGITTRTDWRPTPSQRRLLDLLVQSSTVTRLPES